MTEKKSDFLHLVRNTLRFHQAMGIEEYPSSPDVKRFLSTSPHQKNEDLKPGATTGVVSSPAGIATLQDEINGCTLCQLAENSIGRGSGKGKPEALLMVVGDFSAQQGSYSSHTLFGPEEDEMLWKMMAAIELQPEQVYVTNCLKCCPTDPGLIDATCEEKCSSYLTREIGAINPKMICAMGEMAVRVLAGTKAPLARARGKFSRYRYQSRPDIMVMPTFHPRFLLQHQEMKRATWNDLQAIKRRLYEG